MNKLRLVILCLLTFYVSPTLFAQSSTTGIIPTVQAHCYPNDSLYATERCKGGNIKLVCSAPPGGTAVTWTYQKWNGTTQAWNTLGSSWTINKNIAIYDSATSAQN